MPATRTQPRRPFLTGMTRAFDPGRYARARWILGAAEADAQALRSDWEAVGSDFRAVLGGYASDLSEPQVREVSARYAELAAAPRVS